jgi:hypothetical protein
MFVDPLEARAISSLPAEFPFAEFDVRILPAKVLQTIVTELRGPTGQPRKAHAALVAQLEAHLLERSEAIRHYERQAHEARLARQATHQRQQAEEAQAAEAAKQAVRARYAAQGGAQR